MRATDRSPRDASASQVQSTAAETPAARTPTLSRGTSLALLFGALGCFTIALPPLWCEMAELRRAWNDQRRSYVVDFIEINPSPQFAAAPPNWLHDEGESTLLWAGWVRDRGHAWYHVAKGEIRAANLNRISQRDVIRAIDRPIVEKGGGRRWEAILPESEVVCTHAEGIDTAYPVDVLRKVQIVNDSIGTTPVLVILTPGVISPETVGWFDPIAVGERVVLGHTGYYYRNTPMFYDRQTESLWIVEQEGVRSFAGKKRGTLLRRTETLAALSFAEWASRNPEGRLLIGADRTPRPDRGNTPR